MDKYAYLRVSSKDQNIDRQLIALRTHEVAKRNIYIDYQSGKDFNRPEYQKLMKKLKPGDLLIVKSIDRLGRNYNDILTQWQYIIKELKADILVLDMGLLDTRKKAGDLTGTLISDLVLQIFAYVAQTERDYIHQRQAEGIAAARLRGQRLGRKSVDLPENFDEICELCIKGLKSTRDAAALAGMCHSTFYRHYRKYKEKSVFKGRLK